MSALSQLQEYHSLIHSGNKTSSSIKRSAQQTFIDPPKLVLYDTIPVQYQQFMKQNSGKTTTIHLLIHSIPIMLNISVYKSRDDETIVREITHYVQ